MYLLDVKPPPKWAIEAARTYFEEVKDENSEGTLIAVGTKDDRDFALLSTDTETQANLLNHLGFVVQALVATMCDHPALALNTVEAKETLIDMIDFTISRRSSRGTE